MGRDAWPGNDYEKNQSMRGFEIAYGIEKHQRCGQTKGHGTVLGIGQLKLVRGKVSH